MNNPPSKLTATITLIQCGLRKVKAFPAIHGSSIPPIDVAIKNIPVMLPVSRNCLSAYRVRVGKMTAIKAPALIEANHKIAAEPGIRMDRVKETAAPRKATVRMAAGFQRLEKIPTKIRPTASAPQKREFKRRPAASVSG